MTSKWINEKAQLEHLILIDKLSYEEIGRRYGCSGANIKGVCGICGMKPIWNGKELVFIIDHIDGHASNNRRDNLRCICPNCDSQLDTYKSKNKCGERSYYRYHKNEINNNKN